ncbi:Glycosyltransferase involved in cell wall bisynthesis [Solimonas aquatica]|uniref:Glycosyltransferase involved in cell wall bisynthesis n=1 Tax=Solimonas aquatica TaxID=489703 RepID=A0A1H9BU78_9GAMM|nr:glycosyltransferase [Solimonas aquatica]SEP92271.1 Glycosyltransferase involved in cell wall bisynthesis [Solimonas aquatica]
MKILFIHQNFPAQFKHLAPALAARGDEVRALSVTGPAVPGLQVTHYKIAHSSSKAIHSWASDFEAKVIRAEACSQAMQKMRDEGFVPDLVVVHPGWGEGLCIEEVFPGVPQLHFIEWYYHFKGGDVGFDPEFNDERIAPGRVRAKNAMNLLSLEQMTAGYCPTHWQLSRLPERYRERVSVIHDGIDTQALRPDAGASVTFHRDKLTLTRKDELVTFINRNLEPMRGWHIFARSLPQLLKARPKAHIAIIGNDELSYGAPPPGGRSWRQLIWDEIREQVDVSRVHFVGRVPHQTMIQLLQVARCHVYLTMPFVLSWSMLEAMSVEALVVGSDTPPVQEVIRHGENGLLTPFLDPQALAALVTEVLANPERYEHLRRAARQTVVQRYDLNSICLPAQLALVDSLVRKGA